MMRRKFCRIIKICDLPRLLRIRHMHNQRVELRPSLGLENSCHRHTVQRVRAKAVHRLGRERHQPAAFDDPGGLFDRFIIGGFHRHLVNTPPVIGVFTPVVPGTESGRPKSERTAR